jgi:peptide deformylase
MTLKIVKYGDPVLQKEGAEVTNIDGKLADFITDMFATMYDAKGVGLAAPQVEKKRKNKSSASIRRSSKPKARSSAKKGA